jgi:hypothetical protein
MVTPLNPLLQVQMKMRFKIANGQLQLFDSKDITNNDSSSFSQDFGNTFDLPAATVDLQVSLDGLTQANLIFFLSPAPLQIKLVPQGATTSNTQPLTLYPGLPSLVCLTGIVGIYVSNPTGNSAKITVVGAGVNTP